MNGFYSFNGDGDESIVIIVILRGNKKVHFPLLLRLYGNHTCRISCLNYTIVQSDFLSRRFSFEMIFFWEDFLLRRFSFEKTLSRFSFKILRRISSEKLFFWKVFLSRFWQKFISINFLSRSFSFKKSFFWEDFLLRRFSFEKILFWEDVLVSKYFLSRKFSFENNLSRDFLLRRFFSYKIHFREILFPKTSSE